MYKVQVLRFQPESLSPDLKARSKSRTHDPTLADICKVCYEVPSAAIAQFSHNNFLDAKPEPTHYHTLAAALPGGHLPHRF